MPTTIPTHAAAVLPLKLWRPRRFDGVALVAGSAAPDVGYGVQGFAAINSHSWHSLLWWSLPVALVLAALLRRAAPIVAAHLPAGGPLALRDYGVLGRVRHRFVVTASSALLGAASHVVWDAATRSPGVASLLGGWRVVEVGSELAGIGVVVACVVHIGRSRALLAWHGPVPVSPRRPVLFWSTVGASLVVFVAVVAALPGNGFGLPIVGVRLIAALVLAASAGAAVVWVASVGDRGHPLVDGNVSRRSRTRRPSRRR